MTAERTTRAAIGIDVGGTRIKGGLVTSDGAVLDKASIATQAGGGVDQVLGRMVDLVGRLRATAEGKSLAVEGVGLGMPGTLSRRQGVVIAPPNLPGWRDVPVVAEVQDATGLRVLLDNDANNAALGEHRCGAGRGVGAMVMLTLGTGVGGGIILDGRLWHGSDENAGELGHCIVHAGGRRCGCGQSGCLEAYASASATAERALERIEAGEPSCLKAVVDRGERIAADDVAEAADAGDALAAAVWADTCRYLAVGCINIGHTLRPDRIVLAGGMSAAGPRLLDQVVREVAHLSSEMLGKPPELRLAELGNDAGFIGSAVSVFQ